MDESSRSGAPGPEHTASLPGTAFMSVDHPPRAPRVVIVDDDGDLLDLLDQIFRDEGFRVVPCPDVEAAIPALKAEATHLLITDVRLHGAGDLGVLQWLVNQDGPRPAVIVLTAAPEIARTSYRGLLELAGAHVEAKPFDLDHLLNLARTLTGWPELP